MGYFGKEIQENKREDNMKKYLLTFGIVLLSFVNSSIFALDKARINYDELFSEVAENYGVEKMELPDSRAEYYEEKNIQFCKQVKGKETKTRTEFMQKKDKYILEFFDIGINVFYSTKGKFKVIDEDNQIIQVVEFDNIDNPYYGFFDFDMDGYLDLMIMDRDDKQGTSYHVYYWSNIKNEFQKDKHVFLNPALDRKNEMVYERYVDVTKELVYTFYEYRFGKRRFVAQVRFSFTNYEKEYGFKIVYSDIESGTEGDKGVYVFQFPLYQKFQELTKDEQNNYRKQYEKLFKMIKKL